MTAAVVDRAAEPAHVDQVDSSVPARAPRWPWFLGLAATLQYLLVGVWLVGTKEWLIPDGVERTTNAMAIVLSRDPHLGAMGLY